MLTGPDEEEVARNLNALVRCKREKINSPQKHPRSYNLSEVSGGPVIWSRQDITSKVKNKLLQLVTSNIEKKVQCLVGLFRFWSQYLAYFNTLL